MVRLKQKAFRFVLVIDNSKYTTAHTSHRPLDHQNEWHIKSIGCIHKYKSRALCFERHYIKTNPNVIVNTL